MEGSHLIKVLQTAPSPAYVVDLGLIRKNLSILEQVQQRTGAKILLALKGFAMWSTFPEIRKVLHGVCASSHYEARLGYEEFQREVHSFAPAYTDADLQELLRWCNHIVFNSLNQWEKHKGNIAASGKAIACGLRVNPEHSTGKVALYDPCAAGSRLGIRASELEGRDLSGISGFHFHTLCEQNSDALEETLEAFEERFGKYLPNLQWINFGGGHHISRPDYDVERLCRCIERIRDRYRVQVYLEPGEAVALNTGILIATVLDIVENNGPIAILDTSASAHMPDVLEMPYRPNIVGAGMPEEKAYTYKLGGLTCLAGDVIGSYSFDTPLQPGDRLAFLDMAHYTMVKNTTFNGIQLPAICTYEPESETLTTVRRFGYEDYKNRLS